MTHKSVGIESIGLISELVSTLIPVVEPYIDCFHAYFQNVLYLSNLLSNITGSKSLY